MNGSLAGQLLAKGPGRGARAARPIAHRSGHGPCSSEDRAEQTADQLAPITERDHSRAVDLQGQQCQIADFVWPPVRFLIMT